MKLQAVVFALFLFFASCGADDSRQPHEANHGSAAPSPRYGSANQGVASDTALSDAATETGRMSFRTLLDRIALEACHSRSFATTDGYTDSSCVAHAKPMLLKIALGHANTAEEEDNYRHFWGFVEPEDCEEAGVNLSGATSCAMSLSLMLDFEEQKSPISAMHYRDKMKVDCTPVALCKRVAPSTYYSPDGNLRYR